jgi:predicted membrane-bound spermidine synthase
MFPRSLMFVAALFFLSGAPALVYQMAWQRILALHSGVGIYSVAMIVASFMAGLGLGSHWGGVISRQLDRRAALAAFGYIELGIGALGLISVPVYYDWLYLQAAGLYDSAWKAGLGHFVALVAPTCLMGMSLPVLVRAMVRDVDTASGTIGLLYGMNVLGAAAGAALTPWVLMRLWGIRGAVFIAVALNVTVGLAAWLMSRSPAAASDERASVPDASSRPAFPTQSGAPQRPGHFSKWLALYALCGFTGLALEMIWFRLCDVAAKSTAFTFGTVLALYLFGLAAGSLCGVALVHRVRQPLRTFLVCQCLILGLAAAAVIALVRIPPSAPAMNWLMPYWRGYEGLVPGSGATNHLLMLYVAFPLALFAVPTWLMGFSFCILQQGVQDDQQTSGWKVGALQAANIAGCVAGSLVVGLWMLSAFGATGTIRMLTLIGVVLALVGLRRFGQRSAFAPLMLLLGVAAYAVPDQESLWLRLHGLKPDEFTSAMVDEDATGVVAITPEGEWGLRMSVDGKGHSWLPYRSIHSYLGALPVVMHPRPERVALIGLGSGDTAWAAGCRRDVERIAVFELCAPERRLLEALAQTGHAPQVAQLLGDARVDIRTADGRNALALSEEPFDIIEADASRPHTGFAGNLYSLEFFRLCQSRLRPGGLLCTWAPTPRVYATFCEVFPHVIEINDGEILIGSNEPLSVEIALWQSRIRSPEIAGYLGEGVVLGLMGFVQSARTGDRSRVQGIAINRDLFPRDEFLSP